MKFPKELYHKINPRIKAKTKTRFFKNIMLILCKIKEKMQNLIIVVICIQNLKKLNLKKLLILKKFVIFFLNRKKFI